MSQNKWAHLQRKLLESPTDEIPDTSKECKDAVITDLLADLVKILSDKTVLETEIMLLKKENKRQEEIFSQEKQTMTEEIALLSNELQIARDEIQVKDTCLADKHAMLLEMEKKYLVDVKKQQFTTAGMKDALFDKEQEFMSNIMALESEISATKSQYADLRLALDQHNRKTTKYKSKLQCALTVVAEQQNLLEKLANKPNTNNQETQTDVKTPSNHSLCNCHQSKCNLEKENAILSQLFFTSNHMLEEVDSFLDLEEMEAEVS